MTLIILVPVIPAVIIYRMIPGQTGNNDSVSTKYLGVSIKLGGAFAGYFALVLLMAYILNDRMTNDKKLVALQKEMEEMMSMYEKKLEEKYNFFTIKGKLDTDNGDPRGKFDFNIRPPRVEMYSDGHFFLKDVPITFKDNNIPILTVTKIDAYQLDPLGEPVVDEWVIMLHEKSERSEFTNPFDIEIRDKMIEIKTPIVFTGESSTQNFGGY